MFWAIFLIGTITWLCYYVFVKPMNHWRRKNVKQSILIPLLGDSYKSFLRMESPSELIKRIYSNGKERYYGMYFMVNPMLMIKDPQLIKQIAVKDFDYFTDHPNNYVHEDTDPMYNKNLFGLKGDKWRIMRNTLSPAFTTSKMRAMFILTKNCAEQHSKYYVKLNKEELVMDMKDLFARYTNDIIATCAFGINCNSLKERNNDFYCMGRKATDFTSFWKTCKIFTLNLSPTLAKILKLKLFPDDVSNFFQIIIKNTLRIRKDQNIIRPDMIHLLMEARSGRLKHEKESFTNKTDFDFVEETCVGDATVNQQITDFDITAQALVFFFAGFDSVSTLMSFIAYELALNPDVQNKLRNEIKETREACNGELSYDNLSKMKYMHMVISETLRKWPPFIAADRVCVKPYIIESELEGESPVHLNVGDRIFFPSIGLHYDPEFYPNPDCFDPERFSDENKHTIKPYTYIPFGCGPRTCIGHRFVMMETKAIFYYILQDFEFTVVKKTVVPITIDKTQIMLSPKGGFWLGLKKRE